MEDEAPLMDDGNRNEGSSSMVTENDQENTCTEAQKKDSDNNQTSKSGNISENDRNLISGFKKSGMYEETESDHEKNQDSVPDSQVTESSRELESTVEANVSEDIIIPLGHSSSDDGSSETSDKSGYGADRQPFHLEIERVIQERWRDIQDKRIDEGTSEDGSRAWDEHSSFDRKLRTGEIPLEYFPREPQGTSEEVWSKRSEYKEDGNAESGSSKKGFLEKFTSLIGLKKHKQRPENEGEEIEMKVFKPALVVDRMEDVAESPSSDTDQEEVWKWP